LFYFNFVKSKEKESGMSADAVSSKEDSYRAIARIALVAEWTSVAGILLLIGAAVHLSMDSTRLLHYLAREAPTIIGRPSDTMVLLAGVIALVPVVLVILALWQARKLFRLYRGRQIFAPVIPGILFNLGYLAFGAAAAGIITRSLIILCLTIENPPGQRHLAIGFSTGEILSLIAGLLLFAFSLVVKESQRIAAENESFL
jgi:hypothetical protein